VTKLNRVFVAVAAGVLGTSLAMAMTGTVAETNPFTHLANIPVGSDLSSIKFQGVKKVKVATRQKVITDARYCNDQQFRDPGNSMYCPNTQSESYSIAYVVTYSYDGQPLTSDEYGNRHFSFSVYFRPDELGSDVRRALEKHTMSKDDLAAYFDLSSYRSPVRQLAIDEAASAFCGGNYVDGNWTHADSNCRDKVQYKTVNTPSEYITLKVDPALARQQRAANGSEIANKQ